jgi:hypothetical protein
MDNNADIFPFSCSIMDMEKYPGISLLQELRTGFIFCYDLIASWLPAICKISVNTKLFNFWI